MTRSSPTHRPPTIRSTPGGCRPISAPATPRDHGPAECRNFKNQHTIGEDSHESSKENIDYNRDLSEGKHS